jgi:hypothetical protein
MVRNQNRFVFIAAGVGLAFGPVKTMAQTVSAQGQADGRCLAAMLAMSEQARGSEKAGFESGMMYFMGKIVGRSGKAFVTPTINASAASVTKKNQAAIADRCADEITAVTNAM